MFQFMFGWNAPVGSKLERNPFTLLVEKGYMRKMMWCIPMNCAWCSIHVSCYHSLEHCSYSISKKTDQNSWFSDASKVHMVHRPNGKAPAGAYRPRGYSPPGFIYEPDQVTRAARRTGIYNERQFHSSWRLYCVSIFPPLRADAEIEQKRQNAIEQVRHVVTAISHLSLHNLSGFWYRVLQWDYKMMYEAAWWYFLYEHIQI